MIPTNRKIEHKKKKQKLRDRTRNEKTDKQKKKQPNNNNNNTNKNNGKKATENQMKERKINKSTEHTEAIFTTEDHKLKSNRNSNVYRHTETPKKQQQQQQKLRSKLNICHIHTFRMMLYVLCMI